MAATRKRREENYVNHPLSENYLLLHQKHLLLSDNTDFMVNSVVDSPVAGLGVKSSMNKLSALLPCF